MTSLSVVPSVLREVDCILLPTDPGYAEACTPWNLAFPLAPAAVAVPRSVADVVDAVRAASELGLRIAAQSTGHASSNIAAVIGDDTLLVRLHEFTGVTVDPENRTARVLGGTLWRDVIAAAQPHGLAALHGSAGDVAVAGYVLGGGLSFYGRKHGLASSTVRAFELVTPAGELVRASADANADLFWALRGGGGNFGVVVAIELELLPISDLCAGMLLWDIADAERVLRAWNAWTTEAPVSATTSFRIMRFPSMPELPPFLSGRSVTVIDGAILEDDEEAARILAPLRALDPAIDTFARIRTDDLVPVHMDPPAPTPGVSDHAMLGELGEEGIAAFIDIAGPQAPAGPLFVELRQLGGALAEPQDGALARLDGRFALFALCLTPGPETIPEGQRMAAEVVAALAPWATGRLYSNFAERATTAPFLFDAETCARLQQVRATHDPERRMLAAHAV